MKDFLCGIRAEGLKMKHTFLLPVHILVPAAGSLLFLIYFRFSGWSGIGQTAGYMEIIGVALPFAVSIVCGGSVRLEEENHFQIFLGSPGSKWRALAVKLLVLGGMGFLAVFGAVVLFGAGYCFVLGREGVSAEAYMMLAAVLFLGSLPLYLEHLFLNLAFSRTVSQCAGVAQFLLSALFLTGLGEGRWQFFPCTWSARGVMLALRSVYQGEGAGTGFWETGKTVPICLLPFGLICAIIGIWFYHYEGRQCND